jgi:type I site-specific restriction endonuclease
VKQLNFPRYEFKLRKSGDGFQILDEFRKKWVALTPEEWVRQHTLRWIITEKLYPAGLIAVEKSILINGMEQRFDAVVFNRASEPAVIIECKAPEVKITEEVFDQVARYNMKVMAPFLLITNGLTHYCCVMDHEGKSYSFLKELPSYKE